VISLSNLATSLIKVSNTKLNTNVDGQVKMHYIEEDTRAEFLGRISRADQKVVATFVL
jgi:hypothetical protein